jgi:hypothetical protein
MFVVFALIAIHLGEAGPTTAKPARPFAPVLKTTTPAPLSKLEKGLIGAGAGIAGLAAIGGIAGALAPKKLTTPHPKPTSAPTTAAPNTTAAPATTAAPVIRAREETKTDDGSSSIPLLPLLLGLLLLCCLLGIIGYFCSNKSKRAAKVSTKKPAPSSTDRDVAAPAAPEASPLVSGHWEQPMAMVPVSTAQPSFVPFTTAPPITTAIEIAQTQISYLPPIVETVAPTYMMAAPTYVTTPIVETVAPNYAVAAPTYASTPTTAGFGIPTEGLTLQ